MENYNKLQMFYKNISPKVAGLIGAGLGWMLSDSLIENPRGQMTSAQEREWERIVSQAQKRSSDRKLLALLRRKDKDVEKASSLSKGDPRLQVPPESGRVFDPARHRWVKPENVGEKVARKRFRGSGTGTHEASLATGRVGGKVGGDLGGTSGGSVAAGRKFRTSEDVGASALDKYKTAAKKKKNEKKSLEDRLKSSKN